MHVRYGTRSSAEGTPGRRETFVTSTSQTSREINYIILFHFAHTGIYWAEVAYPFVFDTIYIRLVEIVNNFPLASIIVHRSRDI